MSRTDQLFTAIQTYFDAIYFCDVDKLDAVFHPSSSLFDADNGEIFVDPIASFRADVADRPSPASFNQKRYDEIITIDWLSPLSAVVKLRLRSRTNIFADHLNFVWDDKAGWQIVAKIWHLEGECPLETNG
ncbi:nuclear transport factor 2 family protein [Maritalea mediterranea]|uniref:Nuclear transport factor 2 family protein n=1 Tax=Maritalea mediterranea TaxID=2909667 RepID=A0ABS9E8C7_9HYPH|nr:nuclear transport factor 2 family protein [Maritalea mediterranea]MCF4097711.1 nuclear transport factor 2 family protein [Maritalea mediterranea]